MMGSFVNQAALVGMAERTPFQEVFRALTLFFEQTKGDENQAEAYAEWLASHGWTPEEFRREYQSYVAALAKERGVKET